MGVVAAAANSELVLALGDNFYFAGEPTLLLYSRYKSLKVLELYVE